MVTSPYVQTFAVQDIRTLLAARAALRRDHPFIVCQPFDAPAQTWTEGAFVARIERFAAGLHARGVCPGDRVLVRLDNCPESIVAWLGCAWMGAVAVTTDTRSSADELGYFAAHSRAVAGITQPRFAGPVGTACPRLRWLAVTDTDAGEDPGASRPEAQARFERIDADPSSLPARRYDPMAPFAVQYTSGTTSRP